MFVRQSTSRLLLLLLCGALVLGEVSSVHSQKPGLLIMAHGGDTQWNDAVRDAVVPLRSFCPTVVAFGMAQRTSLAEAVRELEALEVTHIAVVRLFVSPESFREQTEYLLGLRPDPPELFLKHHHADEGASHPGHEGESRIELVSGDAAPPPIATEATLRLNDEGLYDSEKIRRIVLERVQALSKEPGSESVLILAHGEGDDSANRKWISRLQPLADRLLQEMTFQAIRIETLREDWPSKRQEAEKRIQGFVKTRQQKGERVIVVPFRVHGFGPYAKVLQGLDYVSDGRGLLPHPSVTEWLQEQAEKCFEQMGVSNPFATVFPSESGQQMAKRY